MNHIPGINDVFQLNRLTRLHNGKNVFFCKTDRLQELFVTLKEHVVPSILISGNSDCPVTDDLASNAPPCIKKWFSQAVNTDHPAVSALPFGIDNHEDCIIPGHGPAAPHAREKISLLSSPLKAFPSKEIYANFSLQTHPVRQEIYNICKKMPYITTKVVHTHHACYSRSYTQYVMDILDHKMVICPRGNAPADTHRFWETLYAGRIPIIKKNKGNSFFTNLPVIVLETWEKLTDLDFLNSELEKVKNNPKDMLQASYWETLILKEINELK